MANTIPTLDDFVRTWSKSAGAKTASDSATGQAATPGSAASDSLQIGTNKQPTGKDPSNETGSAKPGKEDAKDGIVGGTSHPASTENKELDGAKYAFSEHSSLTDLCKIAQDVGQAFLLSLSDLSRGEQQPAKTAQALSPETAFQTGWELGGLGQADTYVAELDGLLQGTLDKQAADAMVQRELAQLYAEGVHRAEKVAQYWFARDAALKSAEGDDGSGMAVGQSGPEQGAMPEMGEQELMSAVGGMGGGGEAGAGGPGAGGGAGAGGPGAGGPGADGQISEEQLMQLLQQLGMTPEQFAEAIEQEAGSGGGGGPPGAGGPPPGAGGPPGGGMDMGGGPAMGGGEPPMPKEAGDAMIRRKTAEYIHELAKRSQAKTAQQQRR